jgi:excisionase family DNA binding protein
VQNDCEHSNVRTDADTGVVYCVDCGHQVETAPPRSVLGELAALVALEIADRLAEDRELPEPWIGTAEAAKHLACTSHRVYDLTSQVGESGIPFVREGNRLLFRRSQLDAWLERRNAA